MNSLKRKKTWIEQQLENEKKKETETQSNKNGKEREKERGSCPKREKIPVHS